MIDSGARFCAGGGGPGREKIHSVDGDDPVRGEGARWNSLSRWS